MAKCVAAAFCRRWSCSHYSCWWGTARNFWTPVISASKTFRSVPVKHRASSRPVWIRTRSRRWECGLCASHNLRSLSLGGAVFFSRKAGKENGIFLPLLHVTTHAHHAPVPTLLRSFCGVRGGFCKKRLEPQPKFAPAWVGPHRDRWRGSVSQRTVLRSCCPRKAITPNSSRFPAGLSSRERNRTLLIKRAPHSFLHV